jgi:hypothetical protein
MACKKYLPESDADLLTWATNFLAKISASPSTFGLTAEDATALLVAVSAFSAAVAECADPRTRTRVAIEERNAARAEMKRLIRPCVRQIQARRASGGGTITDGQLVALGLPAYTHALGRSSFPADPPPTQPWVRLRATNRLRHTVVFSDAATPTRRAKPPSAAGALVFYTIADPAPAHAPSIPTPTHTPDLSRWRFAGLATRNSADITYLPEDAGKTATIVARWYTKRGKLGPPSNPISVMVA